MKKLYTFIIILLAFATTASAQVSEQEFQALKAFYNATGGDNWTNRTGWENINTTATKDDVTTAWRGIELIQGGHILSIYFPGDNYDIEGELPPEIGDLTWLQGIHISDSNLKGVLPSELAKLTSLSNLALSFNNINGVLPEEIGNMINLGLLSLAKTKINGPLPESMSNLKKLKYVFLSDSKLNCPFPSEIIKNWTYLKRFEANSCGFTGQIDNSLNFLSDLEVLDLSHNALTGNLPSLDSSKNVTTLKLNSNNFSGPVPQSYNLFVRNNILFYIYNNSISGLLPELFIMNKVSNPACYDNFLTFAALEPIAAIIKGKESGFMTKKLFPLTSELLAVKKGEVLTLNAINLSVYNLGGNNNRYKWFKNNVEVYAGNSPSYTVPAASGENAGIYRFEVTNTVVTDVTLKSENITVTIVGGNEAPTDILLSADNVDENFAGEVATITALDPDAGDTHTFILASGNGTNDRDNGKFSIEGNILRLKNGVDFEKIPALNILLMANDGNGGLFTKAFVITVNDVDEAPEWSSSSNSATIDETAPNGTVVFTFLAIDPEGSEVIYSIHSGDNKGAFTINGDKLVVADNTKLNYDLQNNYTITISASDGNYGAGKRFVIFLNKINRLPVIADAVFTIDKNSPVGTIVGTIEASDPEGDPLAYSITAGNAAGAFILDGNTIKVANSAPLDYETTPQFVLSVNVTDGVSNVQATITINLNNLQELTDNDILSFSVPGMEGTAQINDQDHTISLSVRDVDITALAATFTLSPEATSEPASGTVLDFTNPQTVSVTSQSGDVQDWTITVSLTVGISTFEQAGIKLYPNPANQYVNIEGVENGSVISVLSPTGQVMYSAKAHGSIVQIPLCNLQQGLYLLKTETSKGAVIGKFLKE